MAGDHAHDHHVVSPGTYLVIFVLLMGLTALTTWIAFIDLGPMNNVLMLGIAVAKATLVILFFMHVWWSPRLVRVVAVTGFVFLVIMVAFTLSDVVTR